MSDFHIHGGNAAQALISLMYTLVPAVLISLLQDASKSIAKSAYCRFVQSRVRRVN